MELFHRRMGQGSPIVILHGLFGSSDNWGSLARELAADHEVVLVDARDHGRSPHSDNINYPLMAEDLFELLAGQGLRDIVLVGHSMGGKTAMTFTQQHPALVRELVVVDIGPREYAVGYHAAVVEALSSIDPGTVPSRAAMEERMARYVKEPGMVQFLMKSLYWKEPGRLAWRFNVPVIARHMGDILGAIPHGRVSVPTLFIRGGRSDYITRDDVPAIREQFTRCRIEEIPYAGHWVHAQAPDEVLALIRSVA